MIDAAIVRDAEAWVRKPANGCTRLQVNISLTAIRVVR
jgi:hypothetical protein